MADLHNKAITSARNILTTCLIISAVWLASFESVLDSLYEYKRAQHLVAWVALSHTLNNSTPKRKTDSGFELELLIPWPNEGSYRINLTKLKNSSQEETEPVVNVFSVTSKSSTYWTKLPFDSYVVRRNIASAPTYYSVFKKNWADGPAGANQALQLASVAFGGPQPTYWNETRSDLQAIGIERLDPTKLSIHTPEMAKHLNAIKSKRYELFGVKIGAEPMFSGIGIIFFGLSFALIGPLVALQKANHKDIQLPWTIVTPTRNSKRLVLECLLISVSIGLSLLPLMILILQIFSQVKLGVVLSLFGDIIFKLGALGTLSISTMQLLFGLHMMRIRSESG